MEKLITVREVCDRYGCSLPTARKYMRQCNPHLENPLVVPEWAFKEWEQSRTVINPTTKRKERNIKRKMNAGRTIVPRTR